MTTDAPAPVARQILLEGPANFRDLGGFLTPAGHTRTGKVYRSDALTGLSANDLSRLLALGLRTVVDLRHAVELETAANSFARHASVAYNHLPMLGDAGDIADHAERLRTVDLARLNCQMVREGGETLAGLFHLLARTEAFPLVIHCTGGRDRTGVAGGPGA